MNFHHGIVVYSVLKWNIYLQQKVRLKNVLLLAFTESRYDGHIAIYPKFLFVQNHFLTN